MMTKQNDTLLNFPCSFSIKAMGEANDEFEHTVYSIIAKHVPNLAEDAIATRLSKNKRFLSITITIEAQSKEQLDDIYRDLTANKLVLMAL